MPHGQNIISSCRNSQRHKFNVLDSIHHFFSSFFLKYILTLTVICNDSNPFFVYLITVLYFCHVFTKELFYSVMLILRRENKLYFCDQLEVSCGQSSDLFLVALHLYIEAPVITIGHARNISWKHLQVWIIFFSS